jgi:hypothetical protein
MRQMEEEKVRNHAKATKDIYEDVNRTLKERNKDDERAKI